MRSKDVSCQDKMIGKGVLCCDSCTIFLCFKIADICPAFILCKKREVGGKQKNNQKWKQQLPIGNDNSGYSLQILDNMIASVGEPRDWEQPLIHMSDYLDNQLDSIKDISEATKGVQERFIGVISSYIDMLNQVGLFATLVIGFGMAPISGAIDAELLSKMDSRYGLWLIWTSFITVFASGWCVLECIFLAINLNVVSSTLLTGWGSVEKITERAVKVKQLKGINETWTWIIIMFFVSATTFLMQSLWQFLLAMGNPASQNSKTNFTNVSNTWVKNVWNEEEQNISSVKYQTQYYLTICVTLFAGFILFYRGTTKYIQFTDNDMLKSFTSIVCFPIRCCTCYWPISAKYDAPLTRLNYEYEFAVVCLNSVIESTRFDMRNTFLLLQRFEPKDTDEKSLKHKILCKIRNLELFILQVEEGRIRMKIRSGEFSNLNRTNVTRLEKSIREKRGFFSKKTEPNLTEPNPLGFSKKSKQIHF